MATMSVSDQTACYADFMDTETATFASLLKADLLAAVQAVDSWVSSNAASFNNALPVAAKANLTASQKARLLAWVVLKRYNVGA